MNSPLLDAEQLYAELRQSIQALVSVNQGPLRLVGINAGGAWLAERLQGDLGIKGSPG